MAYLNPWPYNLLAGYIRDFFPAAISLTRMGIPFDRMAVIWPWVKIWWGKSVAIRATFHLLSEPCQDTTPHPHIA